MKTISLLGALFGSILSLTSIKADIISPGQQIASAVSNNLILSAGVCVLIVAFLAWLLIRKIKK